MQQRCAQPLCSVNSAWSDKAESEHGAFILGVDLSNVCQNSTALLVIKQGLIASLPGFLRRFKRSTVALAPPTPTSILLVVLYPSSLSWLSWSSSGTMYLYHRLRNPECGCSAQPPHSTFPIIFDDPSLPLHLSNPRTLQPPSSPFDLHVNHPSPTPLTLSLFQDSAKRPKTRWSSRQNTTRNTEVELDV